ncbi:pyridoxamine 5'-phosphate oxidase family protein [Flexibacterium corallicola]|uniref:pyridoxamine 5'-phosphate oxidase family protein n=1 Tax=Flexibacterium corallicola TaxID=3037259 RepID=UPI00286F66E0|nr:pyridoxamine 5'-phosphate oxidase family protein [Pseudovibrio sp. M1P-2-3]
MPSDRYTLKTLNALKEHYETPNPNALIKEVNYITDHYRAYIEKSPFFALATASEEGLDCSPRGDPAGFVQVIDTKTIEFPDRPGNNRLDSLTNIIRNPAVALLFLIPGQGNTLRINGTACISIDPELLKAHAYKGKLPKSVIQIKVDAVYFQCQKAITRSGLWKPELQLDSSQLPTAGQMIQSFSEEFDGDAYDRAYPERQKATIY